MTPKRDKTYLILTKLHRPPLPADLVVRCDTGQLFGPDSRHSLTLVCAPAGYGKSTLIAQEVEAAGLPAAWYSLDEHDGELRTFLAYLVEGVRNIFPEACEEITEMLAAEALPPVEIVAGRLSNDLEAVDEQFILVLDDYHRIRETCVHDVLDRLLEYPPRGLNLVVIARRNPPLSLQGMRGRHILREVRIHDLQFDREHTALFLEQASGKKLQAATIQRIHDQTEGWPVALRLAVLAIRNQEDADAFLGDFRGGSLRLEEYLLSEILSQQPPDIRECLMRSAILQRFCAPLCDALCDQDDDEHCLSNGNLLIRALREAAMPCVPLDEVQVWYRLHHLFQEILERRLSVEMQEGEIADLHRRAASWLDNNGLVEEAIHHYLKAGDPGLAGGVVARHRQAAVDSEQWPRIASWLEEIPEEVVESDAGLLMLQARLYDKQGRYVTCVEIMDRVDDLLSKPDHGGAHHELYQGWLEQLRSIFAYHFTQGPEAIELARRALDKLPEDSASERVYAHMALAASLQMVGQAKEGFQLIYNLLEHEGKTSPTHHGRHMQTLCYMHWMAGDLHSLDQAASTLLEVGRKGSLRESIVFSQSFLGVAHYHLNRLDTAEEFLTPPASDPFGPIFLMHMMASKALSLVHQAQGRDGSAREVVDALVAHVLETGNTSQLAHAQAQQADIALHQGRSSEALRWAECFEAGHATAAYHFIAPELTAARILVQAGEAAHLKRAGTMLQQLQERFEDMHNTRFTIETLAVRALFDVKRGDEDGAVELLTEAVALAQPVGVIRLFVDLGPEISRLLNRVKVDGETLRYVGEIQAAFRVVQPRAAATAVNPARLPGEEFVESLSKRELEILPLLSRHLTNKEIGSELFISPETVKRHTKNIYQKLSVGSRREAVAKAIGLGILRDG